MLKSKKILFLLSGSISAFKACALISKLKQANFEVQCVCTPNTLKFIGEASLEGLSGNKLLCSSFETGHYMDHIKLQREANLIVFYPATANSINTMAAGIGGNLVQDLFLAHDFKKDFLLFPAMNEKMYLHPSTQESLSKLQAWGMQIYLGEAGELACGEQGLGRLMEPEQALAIIQKHLGDKNA